VLVAGGLESISCVQPHLNSHMAFDPELTAKPEIY
jgi:acetyl-CoA C-acetyltransferase